MPPLLSPIPPPRPASAHPPPPVPTCASCPSRPPPPHALPVLPCQPADIYLLDDPLSAVDVHVGSHIFQRCMQAELAGRRGAAVLLVTHQPQVRGLGEVVVGGGGIKTQCVVVVMGPGWGGIKGAGGGPNAQVPVQGVRAAAAVHTTR